MTEKKQPVFVLLDLDDTILDFHKAEANAVSKTLLQLGIEPRESTVQRYSQINAGRWELLEQGLITREEVLTSRFEMLFAELGVERSGTEAQKIYEELLGKGHWFMPGAEELLEALYGKYPLYIVSNGNLSVQEGRIASSGIAKYFGEIFISQQIGFDKPRKEFFDACFARIPGFDRERSIIVGDSLSSDIRGGINAGIKTCWYNPRGKAAREDIRPDYSIAELNELPGLLSEIFFVKSDSLNVKSL